MSICPLQREGLRNLEKCYKERIIGSASSGETQQTKVLAKVQVRETMVLVRD